MRFMFYSHDGFGLGHTRRHLAVASALGELDRGASILLTTGADYVARLGLPRHVEVLKLQSAAKNSMGWFEEVDRYLDALEPWQFTYALLTRSQRVSHENLRADAFARSVDESLKALGVAFGAGGLLAQCAFELCFDGFDGLDCSVVCS